MKKIALLVIAFLILPLSLQAEDNFYDLGITAGDISFSDETLIENGNCK